MVKAGAAGSFEKLLNPTLRVNWPSEPKTAAEFDVWMIETKAALLHWLTKSAEAAQDASSRDSIQSHNETAEQKWAPHVELTDAETGSPLNDENRAKIKGARTIAKSKSTRLHNEEKTWPKFAEHRYAQASWEDFLYYQNVWNRKQYADDSEFAETAAEKVEAKTRAEFRAKVKANSDDTEDEKLPGKPDGPPASSRSNPSREQGTHGQLALKRLSDDSEGVFLNPYNTWRNHMIYLYKTFKLGYRKRMPSIVAPDIAHRYSQPPRGTTPQQLPRYCRRHKHLEERFPRRKRRAIDVNEVEEDYRRASERQKDNELARKDGMEPIAWRIDEEAYRREKTEIETRSGYKSNPLTLKLLPQGHMQHHGSMETSFNWPTSFDSPAWGTARAVTAIKREYQYEEASDTEPDKADSGGTKRTHPTYKTDKDGNRIKKIDSSTRYKKATRMVTKRKFVHDLLADGTVAGRDRTGRWKGHFKDVKVPTEYCELDKAGNRILLPPRYMTRNRFKVLIVDDGSVKDTRPSRHADIRITDQLSDDEDNGCVDSSDNFAWSGNMNPDGLGNPGASDEESGDGEGVDYPSDGDDGESDDDDDLFLSSYRECSGTAECSERKRARLLLESLQARHGKAVHMTVEQILRLQRKREGFENYSDEQITEMYEEQAELV